MNMIQIILIVIVIAAVGWVAYEYLREMKSPDDFDIWTSQSDVIRERVAAITVTYMDGDIKYFWPEEWVQFRDGIKENLFDKDLCTIEF